MYDPLASYTWAARAVHELSKFGAQFAMVDGWPSPKLNVTLPVGSALAADTVALKTEPVPGNPCAGKYPRCSKIYPEYVECDELGGDYIYPSASAALAAIKAAVGSKNISLHGPREATGGPCAGTPGALHYNVRQGGEQVASIGQCTCCEDLGGTVYPYLETKCAILNPRY